MATQKPISTISYNSEKFLIEKLMQWYNAHIIQAFQYIKHKGEDGDKDHIHVRIEPNKKLDPMDLTEELKEFEPGKTKPLGCRPWRPSKEEDWTLYAVHDADYLKFKYDGGDKGEKLPYSFEDIVASPDYDVEVMYTRAKSKMAHTTANLTTRILGGETAVEMMQKGENAFTVNAVMRAVQGSEFEKQRAIIADLELKYSELQGRFEDLARRNERMLQAVREAGYVLEQTRRGKYKLVSGEDIPFE